MEMSNTLIIHKPSSYILKGEFLWLNESGARSLPLITICQFTGIDFLEFGWACENFFGNCLAISGELILQRQLTVLKASFSMISHDENQCKYQEYLLSGEWVESSIWFDTTQVMEDFKSMIEIPQ